MIEFGALSGPIANQKSRAYRKSMRRDSSPSLQSASAQSGSALWFILLAITLLVALTVTVTRTTETSEETGSRDRNRIMASDMLRYARGIEQAVETLRLRGYGENQISFENADIPGYANANCTNDACRLFDTAAGAGMTYKRPNDGWLDPDYRSETAPPFGRWYFMGRACVRDVGSGGAGCIASDSAAELMMVLPWVRRDLCMEINRLVGVTNPGTPPAPPQLSAAAYVGTVDLYTGTFEAGTEITHASLDGRKSGCFEGDVDPDGGFHFYHVLIAR